MLASSRPRPVRIKVHLRVGEMPGTLLPCYLCLVEFSFPVACMKRTRCVPRPAAGKENSIGVRSS